MIGVIRTLLLAAAPALAGTTDYALPLLPAPTTQVTVDYAAQRLAGLDAGLKTLTCEFEQFVRWDETGTKQTVAGSLEYQKKDRLRVRHALPEEQTIVSDGAWLWVHRESTNQVIRTKLEDWRKAEPLAQGLLDLGRYADLLQRYDVRIGTTSDAGGGHKNVALELRPKEEPGRFVLTLRLTTRDFFPADTELRVGGVVVRSFFRKIRYNPPIAPARFQFKPPPGADVFQK